MSILKCGRKPLNEWIGGELDDWNWNFTVLRVHSTLCRYNNADVGQWLSGFVDKGMSGASCGLLFQGYIHFAMWTGHLVPNRVGWKFDVFLAEVAGHFEVFS